MMPEWMKDVKSEDLGSDALRDMADAIGLEATLRLVATYSGMVIYVPKMETVGRVVRDREICRAYDGTNARQLARRYGVSESWVRRVANARRRGSGKARKGESGEG